MNIVMLLLIDVRWEICLEDVERIEYLPSTCDLEPSLGCILLKYEDVKDASTLCTYKKIGICI